MKKNIIENCRYPRDVVQHPIDEIAERFLQNRIASSPEQVKSIIDKMLGELENEFYIRNLADNVRVTKRISPTLFMIHENVCSRLGIEPPYLFIDNNPVPNAFTFGSDYASIVITSGLLDILDENETAFVIAHEAGHLICNHTKYRLMASRYELFANLLRMLPFVGPVFAMLLQITLNFWFRRSELSADRYGVLGCPELTSAASTFAKLAGGFSGIDRSVLIQGMLEQARELRDLFLSQSKTASVWDVMDGLIGDTANMTHPWPAVRAWEVEHWLSSEHYTALTTGDIDTARVKRLDNQGFFIQDKEITKDPFETLLFELTGELGEGVGGVVHKSANAIKDWWRKAQEQQKKESETAIEKNKI
jgi:Zn-dependent protease with chaperone function